MNTDPSLPVFDVWKDFILPLQPQTIKDYFCYLVEGASLSYNEEKMEEEKDEEEEEKTVYKYEYVSSFKSAIKHLYKSQSTTWPQSLQCELETLLKGYKRTLASLKADGKMECTEGKVPLSFAAYQMLSKTIL